MHSAPLTIQYTDLGGHPRTLPRPQIGDETPASTMRRALVAARSIASEVPGLVELKRGDAVIWARPVWTGDCLAGRHQIHEWTPWEGAADDDGWPLEMGTCAVCKSTAARRVEVAA